MSANGSESNSSGISGDFSVELVALHPNKPFHFTIVPTVSLAIHRDPLPSKQHPLESKKILRPKRSFHIVSKSPLIVSLNTALIDQILAEKTADPDPDPSNVVSSPKVQPDAKSRNTQAPHPQTSRDDRNTISTLSGGYLRSEGADWPWRMQLTTSSVELRLFISESLGGPTSLQTHHHHPSVPSPRRPIPQRLRSGSNCLKITTGGLSSRLEWNYSANPSTRSSIGSVLREAAHSSSPALTCSGSVSALVVHYRTPAGPRTAKLLIPPREEKGHNAIHHDQGLQWKVQAVPLVGESQIVVEGDCILRNAVVDIASAWELATLDMPLPANGGEVDIHRHTLPMWVAGVISSWFETDGQAEMKEKWRIELQNADIRLPLPPPSPGQCGGVRVLVSQTLELESCHPEGDTDDEQEEAKTKDDAFMYDLKIHAQTARADIILRDISSSEDGLSPERGSLPATCRNLKFWQRSDPPRVQYTLSLQNMTANMDIASRCCKITMGDGERVDFRTLPDLSYLRYILSSRGAAHALIPRDEEDDQSGPFAWLSSFFTRYPSPDGQQSPPANVEASLPHLALTILDSELRESLPRLRSSMSELKFTYGSPDETLSRPSSPSSPQSPQLPPRIQVRFNAVANASAEHFNWRLNTWEPAIEPTRMEFDLKTGGSLPPFSALARALAATGGAAEGRGRRGDTVFGSGKERVDVSLRCHERLNLIYSLPMLKSTLLVLDQLDLGDLDAMGPIAPSSLPRQASKPNKFLSWGTTSGKKAQNRKGPRRYWMHNLTGTKVRYWTSAGKCYSINNGDCNALKLSGEDWEGGKTPK
eukprot:1346174-Amorphochlora_amoeboformis.AAC.1